jgi:hypothetical protein
MFLLIVFAACGGGNDSETEESSTDTDNGTEEPSGVDTSNAEFTIRASIGLNSEHLQYKGLLQFKKLWKKSQTEESLLKHTTVVN